MLFVNANGSYPEGYKYHACTRVMCSTNRIAAALLSEPMYRNNAMRFMKGNLVHVLKSQLWQTNTMIVMKRRKS